MQRNPVNILYFSSFGSLRWGGQKSLYLLVNHLEKNFYRPFVVLPEEGDFTSRLRQNGITPIIAPLPPVRFNHPIDFLRAVHRVKTIIKTYNIKLLHTDGPRNTFYAGIAAKLTHLPLVWHIRSSDHDPYDGILCRLCDRIILVAEALKPRFRGKIADHKLVVIHNGISVDDEGYDEAALNKIRNDYGARADTFLLLQAARIEPMKGQLHLIEACARLKNELDFRLILVGEICDSEYHDRCQRIIHDAGLAGKIFFPGYHEDIRSFYHAADVVALTSSGEAFPRSILEAMAAGKPVIATDVGGSREAVNHGVTGFVVPAHDAEGLADRIRQLGMNKDERVRMGQAARKRVKISFSIEENTGKTEELYMKLLESVQG